MEPLAYLEMMMKRTKIMAIIGLVMATFWSYGQTVEQVIKDLDAERYTAALDGANKLVVSSPSVDTYFLKGYTILKSPGFSNPENLKAATDAFTAGNALEKKRDPFNTIGLGMVKLASKDVAGAKAIFEEVKKETRSRNADVFYRIAEAYTMFPAANDPAEAILNIDLALEKSKTKDNPEYYFVKVDAYMLQNEGGEAMNALGNVERLGKKLGKAYANMARVWLQSRNYPLADEVINKGIAADPTHAPLYRYQSSYFQTFAEFTKSADAAANYLKYSDGDVKAKLRYAKLAFVAKDYPRLKRILSEIKGSTNDPYILRMEGIVNYEEGKYTQAINDFEGFIKANPEDENFALDYGYIANSYFKMDGDEETQAKNDALGLVNVKKAVSLKDTNDTSTDYYGDAIAILTEKKNVGTAADLSELRLLANKKPHASDYANTATAFLQAAKWDKASEYLDKANQGYVDQWPVGYALAGLAKTYRDMNDTVKNAQYLGAADYEKYLQLLGQAGIEDEVNRTYVGYALQLLALRDLFLTKDGNAAQKWLEQILKLNPDNEDAKTLLHSAKKLIDPSYVIPRKTAAADSTTNGGN